MAAENTSSAVHFRWSDLPAEQLKGTITRKLVTGKRVMVAHIYFKRGDDVPRHAHENEQITYVLEGSLHFWLGANEEREVIVRAGELLVIPCNLPHRARALTDTLDLDIFSPPREDWLNGTDLYLRG